MDEKQNLRYELLKATRYEVSHAKECYEFVAGENAVKRTEAKPDGQLADGIYLMPYEGDPILYTGQKVEGGQLFTGVGVKLGNKSLVVALGDITEDEITLTKQQGGTRFITSYHDAVADWNGKENTDDIRGILNDDILLGESEHIPSLGELYFILLHIRGINAALEAIGGKPLCGWYWASTQYSAPYAWFLYLYNGHAGYCTKATYQGRVRAVSAFLPLNS